jgi:hypothetical protein
VTCSQTSMASTASTVATTTSALASLASVVLGTALPNEEGEELRTPFLSLAASRLSRELVGAHVSPGMMQLLLMMLMCIP